MYLSKDPDEQARIGEKLSLKELGRRFSSCKVASEYYQGDEEGIFTSIKCDNAEIEVSVGDEVRGNEGRISGFWANTKGAAFSNNVQVGDKVVRALGETAYCDLAKEDQAAYCKKSEEDIIRYDIDFDSNNCKPTKVGGGQGAYGTYRLLGCETIIGLGHEH